MRPNDELLQRIGQVRSKWKAFVWMRGLAWVLGLVVALVAALKDQHGGKSKAKGKTKPKK